MNRCQIVLLAVAVASLHGLLFWMVCGYSPLPKVSRAEFERFQAKEAIVTDPETGKPVVYREFQVSTKLGMPDALVVKQK